MAYLLVTNDIDPYYSDVVTLMALPRGFRSRFRYERSDELNLVGEITATQMRGQQGAIIFRHRSKSEFSPIRRIQIHSVFDSKYVTVPEFTVLDFPDPKLRQSWHSLGKLIERAASENSPGGVLRPLIFQVSEADLDRAIGKPSEAGDHQEDFDRWRSVIDSIAHFDFMTNACFLYAHRIYEDEEVLPWTCVRDGALQVRPETAYRIEFASYFTKSNGRTDAHDAVQEFKLGLKTDSTLAVPIIDSSSVVSRYDNHNLAFRAKAAIVGVGTSVEIGPTTKPKDTYVPVLFLPIYGQVAEWQWLSLVMGIVAYVASFAMSDSWQKVFQALGVLLIAALGQDYAAALIKFAWRSAPIRDLREALREMKKQ
jgi:hypothetical protein